MKLSIVLNDNTTIPVDIENYSAAHMASIMNDRQVNVFTIGSTVLNKNIVSYIVSAEAPTKPANVEVLLNNGQKISDYVEGYNATEYTNQINNPASVVFVIGDNVISKNLVRVIKTIDQPATV